MNNFFKVDKVNLEKIDEIEDNSSFVILKSNSYGDTYLFEREKKKMLKLNSYECVLDNIFSPHFFKNEKTIWLLQFFNKNDIYESFIYKADGNPFEIRKNIKKDISFLIIKSLSDVSPAIYWSPPMKWKGYINGCSFHSIGQSNSMWRNKVHNAYDIFIGKDENINTKNNEYLCMVFYEPFVSLCTEKKEKCLFEQYDFFISKNIESPLSPLLCYFRHNSDLLYFSLSSDKPVSFLSEGNNKRKMIIGLPC